MLRLLVQILLLALAYATVGVVTLLPAFAEGYATPFWPAAGVALAALLRLGWRVWPGIWFGSLLVDLYMGAEMLQLLAAFFNASASTLQALLAYWLVRRLLNAPTPLTRDGDLLRFLLLAGPLSCMLASSVGVLTQYYLDLISADFVSAEWLIWWAGDTLGVVLLTPALLLLWPGPRRLQLETEKHRIILPLVITASLLLLGNFALARFEQNRTQLQLERLMEEISDLRFETLPNVIQPLVGIERFFAASDSVSAEEFAIYTRFLTEEAAVIGVDWAPRVRPEQLEAFNRVLQQESDGARVLELDERMALVEPGQRDEYFPVRFSEPRLHNETVIGFDHGFDQSRRLAMYQAYRTGRPVMAEIQPLLRSERPGALVYHAVYAGSDHPRDPNIAPDQLELEGFVVGIYDLNRWLSPLLSMAEEKGVRICVSDVTVSATRPQHLFGPLHPGADPFWVRSIEIGGRMWRLEMEPAEPIWKPGSTLEEQLYLGFSVLAALMAVFAIFGSAGRMTETRREVALRTRELREQLTAREQAELALQSSESRYRSLIETAPFAILVQYQGRAVYLNPQALAMFGASHEAELIDRPVLDFISTEFHTLIAERIQRIAAGESITETVAINCVGADGRVFPAELSSVAYRLDEGYGSLVVLQDISARKQAEEELQRFFELSLDLLCIADNRGYFLRVNQAFTHILGWSEEELLSRPFLTLLHPDDLKPTLAELKALQQGATSTQFTNRYRCKDGSWRWLAWKALPQPNGLVYASAHDVTEQQDATAQLQRLNEDLRLRVAERSAALKALNAKEQEIEAVINNLLECVITIDDRGIIRSANIAVERVFGYSVDELIGQNVSMLMPEPHASQHDGYLRAYAETGIAHIVGTSREVEGRHRNGELIPMELAVNRYEVHGQVYYAGTLRDISERRALIFELINARVAAEEASHAKSAFLATMSHEIRTPMNGVLGLVEVLANDTLSDYQAGLVKTIHQSAHGLLSIIDDILDFSKIEAGRLEIGEEMTDVGTLVEDLCGSLVLFALERKVDLQVYIDPTLPPGLLADPIRLRQVLYNLIGNAIKFSGNRDAVRGRVQVRVHWQDQRLQVAIHDNGIGIAPERLDELFNPFTQAESNTTRRFGGTGLGLAISKRLVEMMQGDIQVISHLEQGSTFTVTLPAPPVSSVSPPSWPDLHGVCCLFLRSEIYAAEDMAAYAHMAGAEVHVCSVSDCLAQLPSLSAPLVLVSGRGDLSSMMDTALADYPHLHQVRIAHGRRRKARVTDREQVVIDGDALTRKAFLQALSIATGVEMPTEVHATRLETTAVNHQAATSVEEASARGELILVAEDDDINQLVILQQLRLLGYTAEIANNGSEALKMWRSGQYALLLTDLHMPEMDGYQLAEAIRSEEQGEARRTPILALTANAMRGEAERARMVGMDAYLTKPVELKKLKAALQQWLCEPEDEAIMTQQPTSTAVGSDLPLLDINVLRELVGDDAETVHELLSEYLQAAQQHGQTLQKAWQSQDLGELSGTAHKLKSSSRSVGALQLGEICAALEQAARANLRNDCEGHLSAFNHLFPQVAERIEQVLSGKESG